MKQNLIPINIKLTDSQKDSISDPKLPRRAVTTILVPKEPADIIRNST